MYDVGGIMTLRHMKIFVAVFENSSITKAAKELHLAQPSVSFSIKELEDYYGQRFFERIGRRIYPTSAAGDFYGYAVHIVSLFETMEKELKNGDELGTIRIGASITIGTHILPTLVKTFQELFPDIRMEAVVNQSAAIEQHVLHNHIDIGMIETSRFPMRSVQFRFWKMSLWRLFRRNIHWQGKGASPCQKWPDIRF